MKQRLIFSWIFVLFSYIGQSHTYTYSRVQLESLIDKSETEVGIPRVKLLVEIAEAYRNFQLDSAVTFAYKAQKEAEQLSYDWGLCKALYCLALAKVDNAPVSSIRHISNHCARWFEDNGYELDALYARLLYVHCLYELEGSFFAQLEAEQILKRANAIKDNNLIGLAWFSIYKYKPPLLNDLKFPHSPDSALLYLNLSGDSMAILEMNLHHTLPINGSNEAFKCSFESRSIASRWGNQRLLFRSNMYIGLGHAGIRNLDSAAFYFDGSVVHADSLGSAYLQMQGLQKKSYGLHIGGHYEKSIHYSDQALAVCRKLQFNHFTTMLVARIGNGYFSLGKYESAIDYILEAIDLQKGRKDLFSLNSSQFRLANLYGETGQNNKAKKIYNTILLQADEPALENLRSRVYMSVYRELGALCLREMKNDSAVFYFEKAACYEESIPHRTLIDAKADLVNAYLDINDSEHLAKADSVYQHMVGRFSERVQAQSHKFKLVAGRLLVEKEKFAEGIQFLNDFLVNAKDNEVNPHLRMAHLGLYKGYKSLGKYELALESFENYTRITNELNADMALDKVAKVQSEYELTLKEARIEDLMKQRELQDLRFDRQNNQLERRKLYLVILAFALLLLASIGYLFFRRYRQKKEREKMEMKAKRTELELENLQTKQKVEIAEIKNVLFSNVSHEFRTPLTLIQVPVQVRLKNATAVNKPLFEGILKNTKHLLKMVDELLDLGKMETGSITLNHSEFNLTHFFLQIENYFEPLFREKKIQFISYEPFANYTFKGDEKRLRIVVNNILKNAYNHTPYNGVVKLQVKPYKGLINNVLRIEIFNSGLPISANDLPYIFDRYYRANESSYVGNGIGLSLCKQIVEMHGGEIGVLSNDNKGVTFFIDLPGDLILERAGELNVRTNHLVELTTVADPPISSPSKKESTVLIVEDNVEMTQLLEMILKPQFDLLFAQNGEEGEQMAKELQPNLILSDIMMPKKSGTQLLKSVKMDLETSHIPIILLTAKSDIDSRLAGLNLNADDYISKPFHPDELKARIHNLLRQRKKLQQIFIEKPFVQNRAIKHSLLDTEFMDKARLILEKKYSNGTYTVELFCQDLALNRNSVHNKFKALTNQSTSQFIKNFRLNKAVDLLLNSHETITDIYVRTGFNSPQTFNRAFKEKFKCSPTDYKVKNQIYN